MAWFVPKSLRALLLALWGADVRYARISAGCFLGGTNVRIGGSYLNRGVFIDNTERVQIGDGCHLGMEAMILTSEHAPGPGAERAGAVTGRPVVIGDGCWIGARAMILPGVTIGSGCVIAAGSVVNADCEADGLYAGTPARLIRKLD